jgi:formate transporter
MTVEYPAYGQLSARPCHAARLRSARWVPAPPMGFKDPQAIAIAGVETGAKKARLSWDRALVAGFLAGAYIAFAGLLAITVSAGLDPKTWGGLPTLFTGTVFALGLVLVVVAGSELLTGNMAMIPLALLGRRATPLGLGKNFLWVTIGNLLGSLFVAYFLAVKTGVVTTPISLDRLTAIAQAKGGTETDWQIFLRGIGCNWLVCLAVWMALGAEDIGGKILAIFFPIMAFVAMGFDHVVANMFFLPAAIFAHVPGIGWDDAIRNWIFAFLGNFVGAALFVAGAYWFLYVRGTADPADRNAGDTPRGDGEVAVAADGDEVLVPRR